MPGNPVTKDQIIQRFIDLVKTPTARPVTWHSNVPFQVAPRVHHNLLGAASEPNPTTSQLPAGEPLTTRIFHILHGFALKLTRFREVTYSVSDNSGTGVRRTSWAALNNLIWFEIPAVPAPGAVVDDAALNAFLQRLKMAVEDIQTGDTYRIEINACHSSCHSSCHGSRGRR